MAAQPPRRRVRRVRVNPDAAALAEALEQAAERAKGVQPIPPLSDMARQPPPKFDAGEQQRLFDLMDEVIEFLRAKWGDDRPCPYCGATVWRVGRLLWIDAEDDSVFPAVPIVCDNCTNTTFINPLMAGLSTMDAFASEDDEVEEEQ